MTRALLHQPVTTEHRRGSEAGTPPTEAKPAPIPEFPQLVAEGKLTMADKDGKNEHTHAIAATTKVTLDGKAGKLADLKKGDAVKVTAGADGKVTAIAATREKAQ